MNRPLPFVYQLRPLPSIDEELDWFHNRSESDMGVSSNFEHMLGAKSTAPRRTPEDAAEAAHRYRCIRRRLTSMADADAGVLQAAYELREWPITLFDEFGRLTGIVVKLACALDLAHADRRQQQLIESARAEWLVVSCAPLRGDPSLAKLRREAGLRFARALHVYGATRVRKARRHVRGLS